MDEQKLARDIRAQARSAHSEQLHEVKQEIELCLSQTRAVVQAAISKCSGQPEHRSIAQLLNEVEAIRQRRSRLIAMYDTQTHITRVDDEEYRFSTRLLHHFANIHNSGQQVMNMMQLFSSDPTQLHLVHQAIHAFLVKVMAYIMFGKTNDFESAPICDTIKDQLDGMTQNSDVPSIPPRSQGTYNMVMGLIQEIKDDQAEREEWERRRARRENAYERTMSDM